MIRKTLIGFGLVVGGVVFFDRKRIIVWAKKKLGELLFYEPDPQNPWFD